MLKFIYMDVCALSRPFDNQQFIRIRLETDAVNLILSKTKEDRFKLLVSPVHNLEIRSIKDTIERVKLETILNEIGKCPEGDYSGIRTRAEELVQVGFGVADAAHVAFAETFDAEFITCDDKLIKKCIKHKIDVWCGTPVVYCEKENLK